MKQIWYMLLSILMIVFDREICRAATPLSDMWVIQSDREKAPNPEYNKPLDELQCRQALWAAIREHDVGKVKLITKSGCRPQEAPTREKTGRCTLNRKRPCDVDDDCDSEGPCWLTGICSKDSTMFCTSHDSCLGNAPCLFGPIKGHCDRMSPWLCNEDEHCSEGDTCMVGTMKYCLKEPLLACYEDPECADKGPCVDAVNGICMGDASKLCRDDSDCGVDAPCNRGTSVCSFDADRSCSVDDHCTLVGKGICVIPSVAARVAKGLLSSISAVIGPDGDAGLDEDEDVGSRSKKDCCLCVTPNPDARWPGVRGSPIVTDMGYPEYFWGKRYVPESENPVGRKNQRKPECCPCGGPGSGHCALDAALSCNADVDCKEKGPCMLGGRCALQPALSCFNNDQCGAKAPCMQQTGGGRCRLNTALWCTEDVHCAQFGPCASVTDGTCSRQPSLKCSSDEECVVHRTDVGPCVVGGRCQKAQEVRCAYDKECGQLGPCVLWGKCSNDMARGCMSDSMCEYPGRCIVAGGEGICRYDASIRCDTDSQCGDRKPCDFGGDGLCALDATRRCKLDAHCGMDGPCVFPGAKGVCFRSTKVACDTDPVCLDKGPCFFGNAGVCSLNATMPCLGDADCGIDGPCAIAFIPALKLAIAANQVAQQHNGDMDLVFKAIRAESIAVQAKFVLVDARARRPELTGPAVQACLMLGPSKCSMMIREAVGDAYHLDVVTTTRILAAGPATAACMHFGPVVCHETIEDAMAVNHTHVVVAIRELQRAVDMQNRRSIEAKDEEANAAVLNAMSVRLKGTPEQIAAAETKAQEAAEASLNAAIAAQEPVACRGTTNITPSCLCERLGSKQCGESLYLAYLRHHTDVVAAIRSLLLTNATSPAVTMCAALGEIKCRESVADAVDKQHLDVIEAMSFLLNGTLPFGTASSALLDVLHRAESKLKAEMVNSRRNKTTTATAAATQPTTAALPVTTTAHILTLEEMMKQDENLRVTAELSERDELFRAIFRSRIEEVRMKMSFTCVPEVQLTKRDACLGVGFCMGGRDCNSPDVQSMSACTSTVDEGKNEACQWVSNNQYIKGQGKYALYNAIQAGNSKAVEDLLGLNVSPNSAVTSQCTQQDLAADVVFSGLANVEAPGFRFQALVDSITPSDITFCKTMQPDSLLDLALRSSPPAVISAMYKAGAKSGWTVGDTTCLVDIVVNYQTDCASIVLQDDNKLHIWKWDFLQNPYDLTISKNNSQGIHGYLRYMPWWKCVSRWDTKKKAMKGCYAHPYDWGDQEDAECDPEDGTGCSCEDALPEDSDFSCEEEPDESGAMKKKMRNRKKPERKKTKSDRKFKKGEGGDNSADDCDWNPFTNLLFFLFCIILKILKPIMTAGIFLELPPTSPILLQLPGELAFPMIVANPAQHATLGSFLQAAGQAAGQSMDVVPYQSHSSQTTDSWADMSGLTVSSFLEMARSILPSFLPDVDIEAALGMRPFPMRPRDLSESVPVLSDPSQAQLADTPASTSPASLRMTAEAVRMERGLKAVRLMERLMDEPNKDEDGGGFTKGLDGMVEETKKKRTKKNKLKDDEDDEADDDAEGGGDVDEATASIKGPVMSIPIQDQIRVGVEGHSTLVMDRGRGMLIFGGSAFRNSQDSTGQTITFNTAWYMRMGYDVLQRHTANTGYYWWPLDSLSGPKPSGRSGHTSTLINPIQPGDGRAGVFFGGYAGDGQYLNDVFVLKNTEQTQSEFDSLDRLPSMDEEIVEEIKKMPSFDKAKPLPWEGEPFSSTWDPWQKKPEWERMSPSGQAPSPRYRHAAASVDNMLIIHGGYGPDGFCSDVAVYNYHSNAWRDMTGKIRGTRPAGRAGHSAFVFGASVLYFGGYGTGAGLFEELIMLDTGCKLDMASQKYKCAPDSTFVWRSVKAIGSKPQGRFGHQVAPAMGGMYMLLVGGYGAGGANQNWRKREAYEGFQNDIMILDMLSPIVYEVSPNMVPATAFREKKSPPFKKVTVWVSCDPPMPGPPAMTTAWPWETYDLCWQYCDPELPLESIGDPVCTSPRTAIFDFGSTHTSSSLLHTAKEEGKIIVSTESLILPFKPSTHGDGSATPALASLGNGTLVSGNFTLAIEDAVSQLVGPFELFDIIEGVLSPSSKNSTIFPAFHLVNGSIVEHDVDSASAQMNDIINGTLMTGKLTMRQISNGILGRLPASLNSKIVDCDAVKTSASLPLLNCTEAAHSSLQLFDCTFYPKDPTSPSSVGATGSPFTRDQSPHALDCAIGVSTKLELNVYTCATQYLPGLAIDSAPHPLSCTVSPVVGSKWLVFECLRVYCPSRVSEKPASGMLGLNGTLLSGDFALHEMSPHDIIVSGNYTLSDYINGVAVRATGPRRATGVADVAPSNFDGLNGIFISGEFELLPLPKPLISGSLLVGDFYLSKGEESTSVVGPYMLYKVVDNEIVGAINGTIPERPQHCFASAAETYESLIRKAKASATHPNSTDSQVSGLPQKTYPSAAAYRWNVDCKVDMDTWFTEGAFSILIEKPKLSYEEEHRLDPLFSFINHTTTAPPPTTAPSNGTSESVNPVTSPSPPPPKAVKTPAPVPPPKPRSRCTEKDCPLLPSPPPAQESNMPLVTIKGKNMGTCTSYATIKGVQRCNSTCTQTTCNDDMWVDNNKDVTVLIGNKKCTKVTWLSDRLIECMAPAGVGVALDVVVIAGGAASPPNNKLFSYVAPVIERIVPGFLLDWEGNPRGPFVLHGKNFGPSETLGTEITFNGEKCLRAIWVSHTVVVCACVGRHSTKYEEEFPGPAGVVISLGGQKSQPYYDFAIIGQPDQYKFGADIPEEGFVARCPGYAELEELRVTMLGYESSETLERVEKDLHNFEIREKAAHSSVETEIVSAVSTGRSWTAKPKAGEVSPGTAGGSADGSGGGVAGVTGGGAGGGGKGGIWAWLGGFISVDERVYSKQTLKVTGKAKGNAVSTPVRGVLHPIGGMVSSRHASQTRTTLGSSESLALLAAVEEARRTIAQQRRMAQLSEVMDSGECKIGAGSKDGRISPFITPECGCSELFETIQRDGMGTIQDTSSHCIRELKSFAWNHGCRDLREKLDASCSESPKIEWLASVHRQCEGLRLMLAVHCSEAGMVMSGYLGQADIDMPRFQSSQGLRAAMGRTASAASVSAEYRDWKNRLDRYKIDLGYGSKATGDFLVKYPSYFITPLTTIEASVAEEEEEVSEPALTEEQLRALIESRPINVRWSSPQSQCVMGKAPMPRRSFSLLPLHDGESYLVFGGFGVDVTYGSYEADDLSHELGNVTTASDLSFPHRPFKDSWVLFDLTNASTERLTQLGVSSTSCEANEARYSVPESTGSGGMKVN